jgi:hypothetical protein
VAGEPSQAEPQQETVRAVIDRPQPTGPAGRGGVPSTDLVRAVSLRNPLSVCSMSWFACAYVLSLTVLASFVVWTVLDSSFRWTAYIVGQDVRFHFLEDPNLRRLHQWQVHGPRLLLFAALALLGLASTGIVFARLFAGAHGERSLKGIFLATALVGIWLAFFMSWNSLMGRSFYFRILRRHDAMQAAVATLSDQWPAERIVLSGLGSYEVSDDDPNLLYIEGQGPNGLTSFAEGIDRIARHADGSYNFAVGSSPGWWVHYLKPGHVPRSSTRPMGFGYTAVYDLQTTVQMDEGWYLAHYKMTVKDHATGSSVVPK